MSEQWRSGRCVFQLPLKLCRRRTKASPRREPPPRRARRPLCSSGPRSANRARSRRSWASFTALTTAKGLRLARSPKSHGTCHNRFRPLSRWPTLVRDRYQCIFGQQGRVWSRPFGHVVTILIVGVVTVRSGPSWCRESGQRPLFSQRFRPVQPLAEPGLESENRRWGNSTRGSNPFSSANYQLR